MVKCHILVDLEIRFRLVNLIDKLIDNDTDSGFQ